SVFLLLETLTVTFRSLSGVSVMRVITSPEDSWHSCPSAATARSVSTTNVRLAGSSAGGTSPLACVVVAEPCPCALPALVAGGCAAAACSAASRGLRWRRGRLFGGELRLHFFRNRCFDFRRQSHRARTCRRSIAAPVTLVGRLTRSVVP